VTFAHFTLRHFWPTQVFIKNTKQNVVVTGTMMLCILRRKSKPVR